MAKILYKDNWLKIEEHKGKVRGKKIIFQRYTLPDVAVILPILRDGSMLLERQMRHGLGKYQIEFPAGLVEKREKPISAAKRELEEETGYRAKSVSYMFYEHHNPAVGNRRFHYFLAQGLDKGEKHFDDAEVITTFKIKPEKVEKMILSGEIHDHKTISAYLYYKNFIAGK